MPVTDYAWTEIDLTHAIVSESTININSYAQNTIDWSKGPDGNYYSNKAPGLSILAVPFYATTLGIEKLVGADPADHLVLNFRIIRFFVVIIPTLLTGLLIASLLTSLGPTRPEDAYPALLVGIFSVFGSILIPFSMTLWAHPLTAFLILLAFYGIALKPPVPRLLFLCGLSAGLAIFTEYTAAPLLGLFCLLFIYRNRRNRAPWQKGIRDCLWFAA
jgi:hypothetical protein